MLKGGIVTLPETRPNAKNKISALKSPAAEKDYDTFLHYLKAKARKVLYLNDFFLYVSV
jgi:hypothetical protein